MPMVKKTLKQRIVDASVVLFQQDGYHNVTVDRIVEYIGASKGGFYHNFKSKDELLYEIHDVFISYVIKQSQEAYDKYDTPITRLCAMLQTLTQVFDVYQAHITVFMRKVVHCQRNIVKLFIINEINIGIFYKKS